MEIQNYTEPTHESLTKIVEAVGEAKVTSCLASCDDKVRIAWDAKQEYDYNNQQISQYRRAIGIADGSEHVSSITNSFARKSQGTNEVGKLIVDGMTVGGHIAYGLGYGMPRWIPGRQNGSTVRVKYTFPVTFRLQ